MAISRYIRTIKKIIMNKFLRSQLIKKLTEKKIKKDGMAFINQYECEAHRELILKGLEVLVK